MIVLRDMMESDIEDYVRWFTSETEWGDWDAPWEPLEPVSEEEARREWTERFQRLQNRPPEALRWKFEIEAEGRHVGWVSAYTDLGYVENEEGIPAIGLDIPDPGDRRKGYGTQAIQQYMAYSRDHGFSSFYTQTWSGNTGMMKTTEKLGFQEVAREKDCREVGGKKYDAVTFRLDLPGKILVLAAVGATISRPVFSRVTVSGRLIIAPTFMRLQKWDGKNRPPVPLVQKSLDSIILLC